MSKMKRWMVAGALTVSAVWGLTAAHALTIQEARGIATGDSDARVQALAKAVAQGDEKTAAYLQALADDGWLGGRHRLRRRDAVDQFLAALEGDTVIFREERGDTAKAAERELNSSSRGSSARPSGPCRK